MTQQQMLQTIIDRQGEIHDAILMSNWLALAGRVAEVIIAIMLSVILVRTAALMKPPPSGRRQ